MRKTLIAFLAGSMLFLGQGARTPARADCVPMAVYAASMTALGIELGLMTVAISTGLAGVSAAINALGTIIDISLQNAVKSINAGAGLLSDTERLAQHLKEQAEWELFEANGFNPCCPSGDGLATSSSTAGEVVNALQQTLTSSFVYKSGRSIQDTLNAHVEKYGDVVEGGGVVKPGILTFTPPSGTFTADELTAIQLASAKIADIFPVLDYRKANLPEQSQKDYVSLVQLRDWFLKASRIVPLAEWQTYQTGTGSFASWIKTMQIRTGLFSDFDVSKYPQGLVSLKTFLSMSRDVYNSTEFTASLINMNEKALMRELISVTALDYYAQVEMLNTLKTISLQLAADNPEALKEIEKRLSNIVSSSN